MATLSTLEALATVHPDCLGIHSDIKALMPERCAKVLLDEGFTDCSYGNDECPSYYLEHFRGYDWDIWAKNDPISIMVVDMASNQSEVQYTLVDGSNTYEVHDNIRDAINEYLCLCHNLHVDHRNTWEH